MDYLANNVQLVIAIFGLYSLEKILNQNLNYISKIYINLKSLSHYSHSIVAGGLDVISYTIRLMCCTSFTIRREIVSNTS